MSKGLMDHVLHAVIHTAGHESAHGNKQVGNGLAVIALGLFLLWIPFIGIPLIILGFFMMFS